MRYFISSLPGDDAENFGAAVRGHWVRKGNAPENMAIMRHVALNLLKTATTKQKRVSIQSRRKLAGWDHEFLADVLGL